MASTFAGLPVLNRGFGGSQIREVTLHPIQPTAALLGDELRRGVLREAYVRPGVALPVFVELVPRF